MPALNTERYARVVESYAFVPRVIETERECESSKSTLEKLLLPERKLSPEEDALAKLLLHLIDDYETRTTAPPQTTPIGVLRHLMEQRGLKQRDLVPIFGTASVVSEVLRGKRTIHARHARALADYFGLTADLFL